MNETLTNLYVDLLIEQINNITEKYGDENDDYFEGVIDGLNKAIDIINTAS